MVVYFVYYFLLFCDEPIPFSIWIFNAESRNLLWLVNFLRWLLLFTIYFVYWLIKFLQLPFRLVNVIYSTICFWPRFYWHLLGPNSKGRSILDILRDPARSSAFKRRSSNQHRLDDYQITFGSGGYNGSTFAIKPVPTILLHEWIVGHGGGISTHLRPTIVRHNVFTSYQVDGAWCFLATINKQVADSLLEAMDSRTLIPFVDDPFHLAVAYSYVSARITEPPDCAFQTLWGFSWHLYYASAYLIRGYVYLLWTFIRGPFVEQQKTVSKKKVNKKILKVHCMSTNVDNSDDPVCFDSDGIPFLIDSCANCIISTVRRLFRDLTPEEVSVTTHSGEDQRQRYVGTFLLQLPDNDGVVHTYEIPDSIYDPYTKYNIIGLGKLSDFFDDVAKGNNPRDIDGTRVTTGGARSHLVWDHGQHELHWMHAQGRGLPVLPLYKGTSYFQAFCARVSRVYDDSINYAFSSSYSISPKRTSKAEGEGSELEEDQDQTGWYDPELCRECSPTSSHLFNLGDELLYTKVDSKKKKATTISVVYEGVNADGLTHIIRLPDGFKESVHKSTLQDHLQASFSNIPQTPYEYQQEVGVGISQEEAQRLARPTVLSPTQQELLSWHHRLYHLSFDKIFKLVKVGFLPKSLRECENTLPVCIECQFGAAKRRQWRPKGKKSGKIRKDSETKPGDGVSVDQIVSAQPGLIPQMSGFLTSDRLWGATTFVDHVSDFVYVHLMKDFSIEETLSAKASFERLFSLADRKVKSYRADNGRFADKKWHDDCVCNNQNLTFCGVGNHRQNGIVEAKNKYLTLTARTLLLQGMRMWPEMISTYFWPFAVKAAAERHNKLHVDKDGNTPESKLYGLKPEDIPVTTFHPLFCPVFVLDHRLHSAGGSMPKWEPRSRCGVYLGHSPLHAGNVALVFNPTTGRVSPAYHVVFDDTWSTVPFMKAATLPPNWEDLVKNSREIATIEEYELADDWIKKNEAPNEMQKRIMDGLPAQDSSSRITDPFAVVQGQQQQDGEFSPASATHSTDELALVQPSEGENEKSSKRVTFSDDSKPAAREHPNKRPKLNEGASTATQSLGNTAVDEAPQDDNPLAMPQIINLDEAGLRRSSRIAAQKAKANLTIGGITLFATCLFTAMTTVGSFSMPDYNRHRHDPNAQKQLPSFTERMMNKFHEANELYDGTCNRLHFLSFLTQDVASNEVFHYHQAMKQDDRDDFIEAMKKEIRDHEEREHWVIVPKSSMPTGNKAIKSIWSFKRKRSPAGELMKHKARLCAHGGMQQWGENYWETYSPVVNMLTVRLLLLICKIHKLESRSIDFVLAFPQAELEEDIWMELPLGVSVGEDYEGEYLLKLKRNLYGLKQASHNWFNYLKDGLEHRGLHPSEVDPCLYLKNGLAVLTYVDDCILISTSSQAIDDLIDSLKNGTKEKPEKFILTDEGDIDKFLGIEIQHHADGSFEISQPHLITRILKLLRLDENNEWKTSTNGRQLPGEKIILHKDENGNPRKYELHWNYRTAIGMLTYLQGNSRPDISVHVHQCARFSINPRRSHERAVVNIGRYLLTTRNRGILYKPDKTKGLECYVDADFAGGWQKADADSASNVMSRTGYVLMYAGCPIHWVSKLQTEIALSTAEAEYIALSQSLREVIPLMSMMKELKETFPIQITIPNFNCTVHEDNQSCISMATKQKFSPRTKHIALKYHHFRSYVNRKEIEIHYINTADQIADALTKPLDKNLFFGLRKLLMGW